MSMYSKLPLNSCSLTAGPIVTPCFNPLPTDNGLGFLDQFLGELRGHGFLDNDAAGGGAGLAGQSEARDGDEACGEIEIGIGEDDGWILAAHFHLGAGHALQPVADKSASRPCSEPVKESAATFAFVASSPPTARPSPVTTLSTPLGRPASVQGLRQFKRHGRRLRRGLDARPRFR